MIFPKPQNAIFENSVYVLKCNYNCRNHNELFYMYKDGNSDINVINNPDMSKEEYLLTINSDGICVTSSCDEGKYRAFTSLFQLLKQGKEKVCCCEVHDKPQFERRAYMLDISRCRMPKPETVKKIIDFLSYLKYNEIQLYMEGECYKYSSYPKYTEDFDCLDCNDIKELDKYCRERYIDFVPNQNSFGHLTPWLKHEEFRPLALGNENTNSGTINPLIDESLDFIDNVYSSLLPHFSSEYVNVGLDEAYGLGKFQMEEYCRVHGKAAAFMQWLQKLDNLTKSKYNKKVMFWSDMIYGDEEVYHMIPKDSVVLEWGYELIQSQRMAEHCIKYRDAGLNFYVCPSCNTHLSFTGRADVTTFNIRTAAEVGLKYGAKGIMITDWGCEEGHPHFGVWSAVPCALAGQYGWNVGKEQDGESFKADFIRNAERFTDEALFGGKNISRLMYRMANYYLLEPERVHVGSMCGQLFKTPISNSRFNHLYDLKDSGDVFYFDNVTAYVKKVITDIEAVDFDKQLKREILLNSRCVILSSELCKLRIGEKFSKNKINELIELCDEIKNEYYKLWCIRNYEKGSENFINQLNLRKTELEELLQNDV